MSDSSPLPPAKPIADLVALPDFPHSAIGQRVDIRGLTGVITAVINNSIKLHSDEGPTVSYNYHALLRLYAPKPAVEESTPEPTPVPAPSVPEAPPAPTRKIILKPDYSTPLVPIESLVNQPDFPACAFGQHVDFHGFSGVVVEIVNRSLKVRPEGDLLRSYNADGLRKIYPKT
jgi:hypothetical protein